MIKIYTDKSKLHANIKYILDNEAFFISHTLKDKISKEDEEILKNIDRAEIIEESRSNVYSKDLLIITPFGITTIDHISTGCKTVINFLHLKDENTALDVTECGWNALEVLFKCYEAKKSTIPLILRHRNYTYNCSKREYEVNGKIVEEL